MWAYKLLRTKYFHGVSSGNQHPYLLKSRYGKVSLLVFFLWPFKHPGVLRVQRGHIKDENKFTRRADDFRHLPQALIELYPPARIAGGWVLTDWTGLRADVHTLVLIELKRHGASFPAWDERKDPTEIEHQRAKKEKGENRSSEQVQKTALTVNIS